MNTVSKLFFMVLCSQSALGNTMVEWEKLKKEISEQRSIIDVQLLEKILYMFHHDEKINERDNTKAIHQAKEMYVTQCIKRISQNIGTRQ